jgi:hypothetical protein
LTPDLNVVYIQSIKATQVPTSVPLTRIYWPTQVESLRLEFEDIKRFGPAAAEEWIKGLEVRGADAIHKASRWEKWYLAGGISQMLNRSSSSPPQPNAHGAIKNVEATTRPKRRAREVTDELKAQRRADIERRAGRLQPPIPPDILVDLSSFQTSLEKAEPLHDEEWNTLKQQLISQYKKIRKAEKRKSEKAEKKKSALAAKASEKNQANSTAKKSTEVALQDGQDAETLVKIRVSALADKFIGDHSIEGQSIEQKDYAQLIIGMMAYVREQFYTDLSITDTTSLASKLTLGDMVWIFDNKIKQILKDTDQDLFSCGKCINSKKRFGFNAVIHHYLSKHAPKPSQKGKKLRDRLRVEWPVEIPFGSSPSEQASSVDSKPPSSRTSEMNNADLLRIDAMAKAIKSVWKVMKRVENIPFSAKVFVSIYHVAQGFQKDAPDLVSLKPFVDVLNNFKSSSILSTYMLSQTRNEDEKDLFTLPGLAKHFHDVHEKGGVPLTDWRVDLIWLPDLQTSQDLQTKVWESKSAFKLTSEALPWLFESEEETSQGGPLSALPNALTKGLEVTDAAPTQIIYHHDERLHGDVPRLLPASVVYDRSNLGQEQARYDTVGARAASTNGGIPQVYELFDRARAHHMAAEGSSVWGSSRSNSWTFSPREYREEPGRHLGSYRPHHEDNPRALDGRNRYPYYPDMELQRAQSRTDVGNRLNGSHSRYYMPSGHHQPNPSARLYHYGESVPPYDRHNNVDTQRLSNGYYTQNPSMIREYRIISNTDHFEYTNLETQRSPTSQRAYDTYASRYALANRRRGI